MPETRNEQPKCANCGRKILRRQQGVWVHDDTRSMYCEGVSKSVNDETNHATPEDEIR